MKTLLVALGILATFGALFWLDRYYKDTGDGKDGDGTGPQEPGGDNQESHQKSINP